MLSINLFYLRYFIELVASRNKKFYVKANMKMLNTIVTEDMTGFAFNQKSEIEINSDGLPEEYVKYLL